MKDVQFASHTVQELMLAQVNKILGIKSSYRILIIIIMVSLF